MREIFELGWLCAYKHNKGRMFNVFHIFNVKKNKYIYIYVYVNINNKIYYNKIDLIS